LSTTSTSFKHYCRLAAMAALSAVLTACGGGSASGQEETARAEFDTSQDPAGATTAADPSPLFERPIQAGVVSREATAAGAASDAAQDAAQDAEADDRKQPQAVAAKINVTSALQLNTIIVNTINAKVSDYSFHKALIKGVVASRLTVAVWQDVYAEGVISTPTGPKLCDGVCPGGSQFDDWLTYVMDVKVSYYEIVTPNVNKVPAIVSDIRKKYHIYLKVMGQYMDAYYPAWSPNGPDIKLDWNK
jgi:hypothetical protein